MGASRANADDLMAVISPDFCAHENVHLTIVKKVLAITDGNFVVTDNNGNIVFKVMEKLLSVHDRHLLQDAQGTPIVTFKKKHLSAHRRWEAFRGDSSDSTDLLFSVRKSSLVQFKTELDVFLSGNEEESLSDFKVVGSWLERSCLIYDKDSSLIAKMKKKHTFGSMVLGKNTYEVTVYPKVDHAFIVALVVILYEIDKDD